VGERIFFAIAAFGVISSAVAVITLKNPFRAAVALIVALLSVALIFLLQRAPFVAMIQVIVYAGAVVVMFLFVIAYLGDRPPDIGFDPLARFQVLAWIVIIGLGIEGFLALGNSRLPGIRANPYQVSDIGSPNAIGRAFLDHFIAAFEGTSLVLLVAAVGAVLLARRAVLGERGR
jgi:NADH-quinone oxidoreductase subunit J